MATCILFKLTKLYKHMHLQSKINQKIRNHQNNVFEV